MIVGMLPMAFGWGRRRTNRAAGAAPYRRSCLFDGCHLPGAARSICTGSRQSKAARRRRCIPTIFGAMVPRGSQMSIETYSPRWALPWALGPFLLTALVGLGGATDRGKELPPPRQRRI